MFKKKSFFISVIFIDLILLAAVLAPIISTYRPEAIDLNNSFAGPSFKHLFGTDDFGRDVFTRILFGSRISLTVGFIAVVIALLIGAVFGAISGYFGGIIDEIMMRFVDVMLAFPSIFLILAIQSMFKPNIFNVMAVIGLTSWMGVGRLVRGQVLVVKELTFVEAARALGAGNFYLIFKHILPQVLTPVIVAGTLGLGGAILTESALSFLGLGVQPPQASWGSMLQNSLDYLGFAPHLAIFPGLFIFLTVLAFNFLGEGLREYFNPKEK